MNTDVVYVLPSIGLLPQLPNNFVDLFHFHCVEAHQCPYESLRATKEQNECRIHQ